MACGVSISGELGSADSRHRLLAWARVVAEVQLGLRDRIPADPPIIPGSFGGAFVTLWRGRALRGCMGRFGATDDIVATVEDVTKSSLSDSRFVSNPVTARELPSLTIEVSILSELTSTQDPVSLTPGVHGIMIRRGHRSGCFLPKVASERGWSAEEFLSNCCVMKGGLDADAWRREGTEVLLFTADAFSDSDLR